MKPESQTVRQSGPLDELSRDGQSLGKVEPILGSSDAQNSAKLLEVNDGPVAQMDRAAVS